MSKTILSNTLVNSLAYDVAATILNSPETAVLQHYVGAVRLYGIPRGGVPAAFAVSKHSDDFVVVDKPEDADIFIDDIIDSGATRDKWVAGFPTKRFFALVDKTAFEHADWSWVVFPWEETVESGIEDNIRRLIQYVGDDPNRGGLLETPTRVAKAWRQWCSGYGGDASQILKVFEDGAENYDEMVVVKDIPIYSKCEHHLADIFGTATIGYIPNGKVVGLSKLSRLADLYARRLQVQERLTSQIADAIDTHLKPKGVGVVIKARHMCMESRGICKQGHYTITSALRGVMKEALEVRTEFLGLAKL